VPTLILVLGTQNRTDVFTYDFFSEGPLGTYVVFVVPVVAMVFGTWALGDEKREETLSFLVLRPIRRSTIVGAKATAAFLAAFGVSGFGGLTAGIALGIVSGFWDPLPALLALAAISTLAYSVLFVALGYLWRWAILIAIVYLVLWELILTGAIDALATFSISRIGVSAYAAMVERGNSALAELLGAVTPGLGGAFLKSVVIAGLALLLTAMLMRRRDLV